MAPVPSRSVRFHELGEPLAVLREDHTDSPDPPPGAVRVRVLAAGLNPADWELCRGFLPGPMPRGVGFDVAGLVDAVGAGVDDATLGELALGMPDYTSAPSAGAADVTILTTWALVPTGLDPVQAAVLPMVVQTADWTLTALGVGPATTVLVHGAGAMVGYGAVQVARDLGARVLATAGPTYSADLESFGAVVTNYGDGMVRRVRELAAGPIDVVLDTSPPAPGAIATLVEIAGDPERVVTISNHTEARAVGARVNLDLLTPASLTPAAVVFADYAARAAAGTFRLPIARTFPLSQWREAAELSLSGHPRGKVVLIP
jgi:NADPH:quinone reductase-like Zn-dependent oxidoreductase